MAEDTTSQRLRQLREELELNQTQFAKLLQVTQGTVARWESKGEKRSKPSEAKIKHVLEVGEHEKIKEVVKRTLDSDGGVPAAAGLMGMLFGLFAAYEAGISHVLPVLRHNPSLMDGIYELPHALEEAAYG